MNLSRSKIFLFCLWGFVFGVAVASFLPGNFLKKELWYFAGVMGFLAISILFFENKKIYLISLLGLFLFFGVWRYSLSLPANTPDKIWHYNNQEIEFTGLVANELDIRENNQKLEVVVATLGQRKVEGKVLVTTNLYPEFNYGDELEIICDLKTPEAFDDFAYDRYLARYNIYSVCYYPQLERLRENQGSSVYSLIFKIKNKLRERINQNTNEPYTSLVRAIILGDKKQIPEDLRIQFSRAGISHIMAISGMHIAILILVINQLFLLLGLRREQSFYITSLFLFLYILLIGLPASALRAGLMGFLVLWALRLGRLNRLNNSLLLVAAILLLINPRLLRDDVGFQLSFLAVGGIAWIYPRLTDWLQEKRVPRLLGARDILVATLAAQIFTLPIIAINFSQISLVAPLANLLILWLLPFLLISILIALVLSFVFPGIAVLFFLPAQFFLWYIIKVSAVLVHIPHSYIEIF